MVKLDMFCGLLGVGKTSLIKKMLSSAYSGHKVAIIENEFGKVNLDAAELASASIRVRELTSGCICCTVKGDLADAVSLLICQEHPEYIIVEASGVADLRSLLKIINDVDGITVNRVITVVNCKKIVKLLKVVGNFFLDQIRVSDTVYLNFSETLSTEAIEDAKNALLDINPLLKFVSTPLEMITEQTFPDRVDSIPAGSPKAEVKPFGRFTAERNTRLHIRSASGSVPDVESWEYSFTQKLTHSQFDALLSILSDESRHTLWRAKGYLEMTDGSIQKIDYTFGDIFRELRDVVAEEHSNLLVLIGPNLDTQWLEQQFEELFHI